MLASAHMRSIDSGLLSKSLGMSFKSPCVVGSLTIVYRTYLNSPLLALGVVLVDLPGMYTINVALQD